MLDVSLVDEVIEVTDEDAIETTRQLGRDYGLLVGICSGANVWAARRLAEEIGRQHRHGPARPRRAVLQHGASLTAKAFKVSGSRSQVQSHGNGCARRALRRPIRSQTTVSSAVTKNSVRSMSAKRPSSGLTLARYSGSL